MNMMVADEAKTLVSPFAKTYDNWIGGKWTAPVNGRNFDNVSPITGKAVCQVARSDEADIELALDAAHAAPGARPT